MILFHCPGSKILDDLGPILFAHAVRAWANVIITQDIAQNVSKSKFGASRVALYRPVGHSLPSTCCTQSTQSRSILLFSLFVTLSVSTEQQSCCLTRFVSFVQTRSTCWICFRREEIAKNMHSNQHNQYVSPWAVPAGHLLLYFTAEEVLDTNCSMYQYYRHCNSIAGRDIHLRDYDKWWRSSELANPIALIHRDAVSRTEKERK